MVTLLWIGSLIAAFNGSVGEAGICFAVGFVILIIRMLLRDDDN